MATSAPTTTTTAPPVPSQWSPEVVEQYDPVHRLGTGGFASVLLAKKKDDGAMAAIKVVGSSTEKFTKQDHGYAHREIDILNELSHPNIMQVLKYWEPAGGCIIMALSYSSGPTLEHLLRFGGAVGMTFGRVVMAQLMDALAYCHSRAVIHRDIKPDNIIVTGAATSQDEIWVDDRDHKTERSWDEWKTLCKKWHVTLIDFGFARALSPKDVNAERSAVRRLSSNLNVSRSQRHSNHSQGKLNRSVSHAFNRTMSALGNRFYAAPEITQGVHSRHGGSSSFHNSAHSGVDITKTLSHHVADYGLLADAFSLGNTLQYMMTGVPPNQNVKEVIDMHNSPIAKVFQCIAKHACGSANSTGRTYQYRGYNQMPKELVRLIRGLNHPSVTERISVRASRRYPYIEAVLDDPNAEQQEEAVYHRLDFLPCTKKDNQAGDASKQEASEQPEPEQIGVKEAPGEAETEAVGLEL